MPRGPRIDYPGLLQHVIVRGIEKRNIFSDEHDYQDFVARLEKAIEGSGAIVLAWTLMPNHVHILIRTGKKALSTIMRRLLTGYAIFYNRKHKRVGYLYQGRYKSIVCEEDPYLLELVRYIHLNPLRAGLVKKIEELDGYKWGGHSVIIGKQEVVWQDRGEILSRFGNRLDEAIDRYRAFMIEGMRQGKREDLIGGGLIRSLGGVGRVLMSKQTKEKQLYDQRILGGGKFVEEILKENELREKNESRISIDELIGKVGKFYKVEAEKIKNRKRRKGLGKVKAIIVNIGIDRFGIPGSCLARKLGLTKSEISKLNKRGEVLIKEEGDEVITGVLG